MSDHFFKGKNVVVTGTFRESRATVEGMLTDVGARVQGAVRGSTDYLICGERTGATKTLAAERQGVKMLNMEDYYNIMANGDRVEAAPIEVKPKMTHAEYIASLPAEYGAW